MIRIVKYSNRALFSYAHKKVVTLTDIADLIRAGRVISVTELNTGKDVTRQVLLQIIHSFEEKDTGHSGLLTRLTLESLIRARATIPKHVISFWTDFLLSKPS